MEQKIPVLPTLKKMEVNQKVDFPLHRYPTVHAAITTLSYSNPAKFTTRTNRTKKVITVERLS
jgi:hypothetical protein